MEQQTLRQQILSHKPTDQQQEAIFTEDTEFLLRASPGSGKTWTSCRRFIWRAEQWPHAVGGLALLSFTNVAIQEFQIAARKLGRAHLLSDPNYLGTFDAFVERYILGPFGHLLTGASKRPRLFLSPRPGDRSNNNLKTWVPAATGTKQPVYAWDITPHLVDQKVRFKSSTESGAKTLDLSKSNPVNELLKLGYYSHSQRAYWACQVLFRRPHIAKRLAMRFPEIIIDEAQDTNAWLMILLNYLRTHGSRITAVGDPDQCIYSFAMADATALPALKDKWGIPEKPLSKSFRCNDPIADAVRHIGGNLEFTGRGDPGSSVARAFIVREPSSEFTHSVAQFQNARELALIPERSSAIICRAHTQLQSVRGQINFTKLQGIAKVLAEAAFLRDCRKDFKTAFNRVRDCLRNLIWDDAKWKTFDEEPDVDFSREARVEMWRFVKSETGLPSVSLNGSDWVTLMKDRLVELIKRLGAEPVATLSQKLNKKGLEASQLTIPLFKNDSLFPAIRQETIHGVKGESIGAVLVVGSTAFWNSVLTSVTDGKSSEDRRLAYVAMSRACDLLVVSLPSVHFDKHHQTWVDWGFVVI